MDQPLPQMPFQRYGSMISKVPLEIWYMVAKDLVHNDTKCLRRVCRLFCQIFSDLVFQDMVVSVCIQRPSLERLDTISKSRLGPLVKTLKIGDEQIRRTIFDPYESARMFYIILKNESDKRYRLWSEHGCAHGDPRLPKFGNFAFSYFEGFDKYTTECSNYLRSRGWDGRRIFHEYHEYRSLVLDQILLEKTDDDVTLLQNAISRLTSLEVVRFTVSNGTYKSSGALQNKAALYKVPNNGRRADLRQIISFLKALSRSPFLPVSKIIIDKEFTRINFESELDSYISVGNSLGYTPDLIFKNIKYLALPPLILDWFFLNRLFHKHQAFPGIRELEIHGGILASEHRKMFPHALASLSLKCLRLEGSGFRKIFRQQKNITKLKLIDITLFDGRFKTLFNTLRNSMQLNELVLDGWLVEEMPEWVIRREFNFRRKMHKFYNLTCQSGHSDVDREVNLEGSWEEALDVQLRRDKARHAIIEFVKKNSDHYPESLLEYNFPSKLSSNGVPSQYIYGIQTIPIIGHCRRSSADELDERELLLLDREL